MTYNASFIDDEMPSVVYPTPLSVILDEFSGEPTTAVVVSAVKRTTNFGASCLVSVTGLVPSLATRVSTFIVLILHHRPSFVSANRDRHATIYRNRASRHCIACI